MNELKVGKYILSDWFEHKNSLRYCFYRNEINYGVALNITNWPFTPPNHWYLYFGSILHIDKAFEVLTQQKMLIGTVEEVKQQIDDYLIRLSNLTTFF